jgi:hypothetical protein
MVMLG